MPIDVNSRLQSIATKSGKTIAEIQNLYNTTLSSLPPNITGEQTRAKYALKIVNRDSTGGSKSNAIAFEGVIIGAEEARDVMESVRKSAIAEYSKNPDLATSSGLVRVNSASGTIEVLDNRQTFPDGKANPNFGKPRPEHFLMRNVIIACRKPGESNWTAGKINLRGDQASLPLVYGKLVHFRALGEINTQTHEYDLRSASVTQFETKQELGTEEVIRILDTAFASRAKELGECLQYHKGLTGPAFYNRLVVTEGTVRYIKYSSDPTKSHMVILADDSLIGAQDGVQVWVPYKLRSLINFGTGSIITVVGRTRVGPGWDREKRIPLPDVESLSLEAFSLFGRPGLVNIVEDQGPDLL